MADDDVKPTTSPEPAEDKPRSVVALPTQRELELELRLKERDEHLNRLVNEITILRRHRLQPDAQPSADDPFTLPPSVLNLITPLLSRSHSHKPSSAAQGAGKGSSGAGSATVTAALTARLVALQRENDELYGLLKAGAVGRLHEEVRELRAVSHKLELALKESHTVISALKIDLEETTRVLDSQKDGDSRSARGKRRHHPGSRSRSPKNRYRQLPQSMPSSSVGNVVKPIPTGPRALKKPRLSHDHPSEPTHQSRTLDSKYGNGSDPVRPSNEESRQERSHDRGSGNDSRLPLVDDVATPYDRQSYDEGDRNSDAVSQSSRRPPSRGRGRSPSPRHSPSPVVVHTDQTTRSPSRSPVRSEREFSYSPDPPPRRSRHDNHSELLSRSFSRSQSPSHSSSTSKLRPSQRSPIPARHRKSPSPARTISRSRSRHRARSPSPRRPSPHSKRDKTRKRTPSQSSPRRSRSPSRLRNKASDVRPSIPLRRERERRSPAPSTTSSYSRHRHQQQDERSSRESRNLKDKGRNSTGSAYGSKRRKGPMNGLPGSSFSNRSGPASSGGAGTLASRIQ